MERKNRFYIETLGCQMNVNDSEKVAGLLVARGYEAVGTAAEADFVFVNTCAVREKAAEKLFHVLGRLKKLKTTRPDLVIGVGGCVAQLQGTALRDRAPFVDVLVGTHNVARVPELVERARAGFRDCVDLDRRSDSFAVPDASIAHSSPVRAYVTVMEGCNHVCSFCVVPRTRGPEVCRSPDAVLAEVRSLVERGYAEVTLLGQTVNAYRHGTLGFADLLAQVDAVPGLGRLRFTTSHPGHADAALGVALSSLPSLCPHLHLPAQSGSDRVLRDMRRGYTAGEYRDTVARLRRSVPGLALSSDVIVGYPGETESEFEATVSLVDEVGFEGLFVFLYSPRPGTLALREADDVPEVEKRRRLQVLNTLQQRRQAASHQARVGQVEEVLVDTLSPGGRVSGRTRDYCLVHFDGGPELLGETLAVRIVGAGPNALMGERAQQAFH